MIVLLRTGIQNEIKGAFVWDQSGIRIIGILRVSVRLGAILIPEYLDFHSGYSTPRSRIAGIYSGIHSYSGISQTNAPLDMFLLNLYNADFLFLLFFALYNTLFQK